MSSIEDLPFSAHSFYSYLNEHKLMGSQCQECKAEFLPPRAICPKCHQNNMQWVSFSGDGELAAYTSVYIGPSEMVKAGYGKSNPYLTGIVRLSEGPMISARIIGLDPKLAGGIKIGTRLKVVFLIEATADNQKPVLAFSPI